MSEILTRSLALHMIHPQGLYILTGPNLLCSVWTRMRISSLIPPRYTSIPPWNVHIVTALPQRLWVCELCAVQLEGGLPWGLWVRPCQAAEGGGSVPSFTTGT